MKKFALTVTLLGLWATGAVHAGEFFCDAGNVTCLIDAINKANLNNDENTINLAAGTYTLTSVDNSSTPFGNNGLPQITSPILINGESAETTIIERDSDAPAFGIFAVGDSGTLTLNGLTVRGSLSNFGGILNTGTLTVNDSIIAENRDLGSGFGGGISNRGTMTMAHSIVTNNSAVLAGGGIFNSGITNIVSSSITDNTSEGGGGVNNFTAGATMIVQNSTISNNNADGGGGIANSGTMTVTSTTISDNLAGFFDGGGIANGGTLTITNSTISRNIAGFFASRSPGGGIANNDGIVKLQNTIMASNFADSGNDCFGPITSLGNNIIGDPNNCDINLLASDITGDPGLGDFVDDGMPGRGHFPLNLGSQAIDAGNPEACLQADQLGFLRIGICDIGAVEFRGPMLVSVDVRPRSEANRINPNSTKNINVAILSVNGFAATTVDSSTVRFGATGTEAVPINAVIRDVDGDGDLDMVLRFQIQDTGIKCGDTSAILTGEISSGPSIIGSSPIRTVQCGT